MILRYLFLLGGLLAGAACAKRETTIAQGNRTGVLHVGNGGHFDGGRHFKKATQSAGAQG